MTRNEQIDACIRGFRLGLRVQRYVATGDPKFTHDELGLVVRALKEILGGNLTTVEIEDQETATGEQADASSRLLKEARAIEKQDVKDMLDAYGFGNETEAGDD